jgi:hypothetical protein
MKDHHNVVRGALTAGGTGNVTFATTGIKARPLTVLAVGWKGGIHFSDPNGVDWELSKCTALGNGVFSRDDFLHSSTGSRVNLGVGAVGEQVATAGQLNAFVSRASISGIYAVGETLTAAYPADVVGTIQFTRTQIATPYTKTAISNAVASAVNSLTYKVTTDDQGCRIDVDCSNQVSTATGGEVPAGVVVSSTFRSIYTMDLSDDTTYGNRVMVRDSLRTSIIMRNKNIYPLQYAVSTSTNNIRSVPSAANFVKLEPGQEVYATGTDQWFIQPFIYTTESLTSSGTTATVKLTNHGFTTGQTISMRSATPSTYRWGGVITVIDANTFTYQTSTADLAAATVQGKFVLTNLTVEIELQGAL